MKIYKDYDFLNTDAFEDCVSMLMLRTISYPQDFEKLYEAKSKRKYLIRFRATFGRGLEAQARFYTDDAETLAKFAKLVQKKFKAKDVTDNLGHNLSISFESASGRKQYGCLYAFIGNKDWNVANAHRCDEEGFPKFDFSDRLALSL